MPGSSTIVSNPLHVAYVRWRLRARVVAVARSQVRDTRAAVGIMRELREKRKAYLGGSAPTKFAKIAGRYYSTLVAPGWPGPSLDRMIATEIDRARNRERSLRPIRVAFVSVTKKCPLNCEHCYDWHNLNKKDVLSLDDLCSVVDILQHRGVSQIFLSGGEPLVRFDDVVELLRAARDGTDVWLLTSGFHLTPEKARRLRESGLTGVSVSVDHFDEQAHNHFRGLDDSFRWATAALRNARAVGLVTAASICLRQDFVTRDNLFDYAAMVRDLGAAFIQILEPRAVGRYEGENVSLSPEQLAVVDDFYLTVNFDREYRTWPIVAYHGHQQRKVGCSGAGDRYLYVDADGRMHACPFCQHDFGSVLEDGIESSIEEMRQAGCMSFEATTV